MSIYSVVYCITAGESAGTDGLKCLVLCLKSAIAAGETEVSDLYEAFLDLLLQV